MTPVQKLKQIILQSAINLGDIPKTVVVAPENVDSLYEEHYDATQDARQEIRYGECKTTLSTQYNSELRGAHRNYECDEVAMQCDDGTWIGWTYWHGGGKHSEPTAIPWVEYAYALECKEEEKMVIVRSFTKPA